MSKLNDIWHDLIHHSTRFFKTDMYYMVKGSFWMTTVKVITGVSSFATSIMFANFIPKEVYGLYRFVLSYFSLLTLPTLGGVDTSLTKSVGQGYRGSILPIFLVKIKWGLLAALGSLSFAVYYFIQNNNSLALSFFFAALFLPLMDPLQLYMSYLNGTKDYVTYTKYHTYLKLFVTIILVITLFLTDSLPIIIFSYLVSYTLLRLIFFLITVKKMKVSEEDSGEITRIISYGKHLSFMNVLGSAAIALDKILVFHFVGAAALAGYYLAMVPYKQVQNFVSSLNALALPKFADNTSENLRKSLPKKILKSYIFIVPIIVGYIIFAPYAFQLLYPKYIDIVWISDIFMLQLLFIPIFLFNTALIAQGSKRKLYKVSVSSAIIRIGLLSILIPLWGINGAVATILLTIAYSAFYNFYLFYREDALER